MAGLGPPRPRLGVGARGALALLGTAVLLALRRLLLGGGLVTASCRLSLRPPQEVALAISLPSTPPTNSSGASRYPCVASPPPCSFLHGFLRLPGG